MAIENVVKKHVDLLNSVGRAGLNIQFPKEFELYMCAFELCDANFTTLQYFVFPVMPTTMDETQTYLSNIKKTLGGVVVLNSNAFIPRDITIAGTFGRKFRVLLGADYVEFVTSFVTAEGKMTANSFFNGVKKTFDERVKTGFGCLKILEELIDSADIVDEKGSRRLIFHNPASGNSYLINPVSLKLSQSQETNMIWSYSLSMKAIANLEDIRSDEKMKQERLRLNATGLIQRNVNGVIDEITRVLANVI